jgi:hypothetical protein
VISFLDIPSALLKLLPLQTIEARCVKLEIMLDNLKTEQDKMDRRWPQ